ncbi:tetratricopeptide repeat protein [Longispora urticae]
MAPPLSLRDASRPLHGRDALLAELADLLERPEHGDRVRLLHGLGGTGKTALALELARLARGTDVWWVSATDTASLTSGMHFVARLIGIAEEELRQQDTSDLLWRRLSARTTPWLLIVDNADQPGILDVEGRPLAEGRGWVRPLAGGPGLVLVTSREADHRRWGPWWVCHRVEKLSPAEGAHVLLDHADDRCGDRAEAEALSVRLGGLPLALRLAGSYLADAATDPWPGPEAVETFSGFRAALDDGRADLLAAGADDEQRLIDGIWHLSLHRLEQRGLPLARPFLKLLAQFADAPVPYRLLLDRELLTASPIFALLDPNQGGGLLKSAAQMDLLELPRPATDEDPPTLLLHPLMRDASRRYDDHDNNDGGYRDLAARLLCHAVRKEPDESPQDPRNWPLWRALAPHALQSLRELAEEAAVDGELLARVAHVVDLCARQSLVRGTVEEAAEQYGSMWAVCRSSLGAEHPATLSALHGNALIQLYRGNYRAAMEEFEAALETRLRVLGAEHPDTLATRGNAALTHHFLGRYAEALIEHRAVFDIRRRVFGEEHPETLISRSNVASALSNLGRYAEALVEHRVVLELRRRVSGGEHPETLTSWGHFANALGAVGLYAEAFVEHRAVLELRRRVSGEEHPDTLISLGHFANALGAVGRHSEALVEHRAVFELRRRVLGGEHPDTLISRNNVASALGNVGRHSEALVEHRVDLEICRRVLGEEHPDTLTSRNNFAIALSNGGRHAEALVEHQAVLALRRTLIGEEHPYTLASRMSEALVNAKMGSFDLAIRQAQRTVPILERVLGSRHPETVRAQKNLQAFRRMASESGARSLTHGPGKRKKRKK